MKKLMTLVLTIAALAMFLLSGCGGGNSDGPQLRIFKVGDSWTFKDTYVYTPGGGAPITFVQTHKVTVVNNNTVPDSTGIVYSMAFKHESTQASDPPNTPPLTELDLFTQDPATADVVLVGNVTPSGTFLNRTGTLFLGRYVIGAQHSYVWDINDKLVYMNATATGKVNVAALGRSLDCWLVNMVEDHEPTGQDIHQNGTMTMKIEPTVGFPVELTAGFDTPGAVPGTLNHITVSSVIQSTNVPM